MDIAKFERVKRILGNVIVGDCCKETYLFKDSATKAYLDDVAKEMPDVFTDKGSFLSLLHAAEPTEDLLINMAYGLARCMPSGRVDNDAVDMFCELYCAYIDHIYTFYAGDAVKEEKDVLKGILKQYYDKRRYLSGYYKEDNDVPNCCLSVSRDLILDDEILDLLLHITAPEKIYCGLLTEEDKKDKGIVRRLLMGYKDHCFGDYAYSFSAFCECVPRKILMDEGVKDLFYEIGVPSVIYDRVLTEKEKLDGKMIGDLLKLYDAPGFPNSRSDRGELRRMWAEAVYEDIYRYTDVLKEFAKDIRQWMKEEDAFKDVQPYIDRLPEFFDLVGRFFEGIGEHTDTSIRDLENVCFREMAEMDSGDELSMVLPEWYLEPRFRKKCHSVQKRKADAGC